MRDVGSTLIFTFVMVSLQSCMTYTSDSFKVPNNRFQSPESSGGFGDGIVAAGYANTTTVILTDPTAATDAEIVNASEVKSGEGLLVQASAGLHSKLDLVFYKDATGLKLQALGAPASEAKAGNMALSLVIAGGRASSESSGYKSRTKVEYSGIDSMIVAGYRVQDNQLVYANLANSKFKAEGSVTKDPSGGAGNTTSINLKTPERIVRETSLLLGWQGYYNQTYIMLETGYTFTGLEGKNSLRRLVLGGTLGLQW